jgi:hypothetical protein
MPSVFFPVEAETSAVKADWFVGHQLSSIACLQQHVWQFAFSSSAMITVGCLWRIVSPRILLTNEDHQQKFGLPAPLDAVACASELLVGRSATEFNLRGDTLDLLFTFSGGTRLEVLATSSGYEAWQMVSPGRQHFIAVGGGRLDTYYAET